MLRLMERIKSSHELFLFREIYIHVYEREVTCMKKLFKRIRGYFEGFKEGFNQEWNRQMEKGLIEVREFR